MGDDSPWDANIFRLKKTLDQTIRSLEILPAFKRKNPENDEPMKFNIEFLNIKFLSQPIKIVEQNMILASNDNSILDVDKE